MKSSRLSQAMRQVDSITCKSKIEHPNSNPLRFGESNQFKLSVANNLESRKQAYQLVYKAYLKKNYTKVLQHEMWVTPFDFNPSTITFIISEKNRLVGTVTVVMDSQQGLPAEDIFENEVSQLRKKNISLAEITALAIDEGTHESSTVLKYLCNAAISSHLINNNSAFLITVNPRHAFFYRKKLLFEQIKMSRLYKKVSNAPASLLMLNNRIYKERCYEQENDSSRKIFYKKFLSRDDEANAISRLSKQRRNMTLKEKCSFNLHNNDGESSQMMMTV